MVIKFLPFTEEKYYEQTKNLLMGSWLANEPLSLSCGEKAEQVEAEYEDIILRPGFESGVSLIAVDDDVDRVVGFRLSTLKERTKQLQSSSWNVKHDKDYISKFLNELEGDIFSQFPDAHRLLRFLALGVDERYYRRGIAQKLTQLSLELGKSIGCDYCAVSATNYKSQLLFEKLGFEPVSSLDYRKWDSDFFHSATEENPRAAFYMYKY